jgi:hypothetical protein
MAATDAIRATISGQSARLIRLGRWILALDSDPQFATDHPFGLIVVSNSPM